MNVKCRVFKYSIKPNQQKMLIELLTRPNTMLQLDSQSARTCRPPQSNWELNIINKIFSKNVWLNFINKYVYVIPHCDVPAYRIYRIALFSSLQMYLFSQISSISFITHNIYTMKPISFSLHWINWTMVMAQVANKIILWYSWHIIPLSV